MGRAQGRRDQNRTEKTASGRCGLRQDDQTGSKATHCSHERESSHARIVGLQDAVAQGVDDTYCRVGGRGVAGLLGIFGHLPMIFVLRDFALGF